MSKTHGATAVTALWRRLDTPGHDACRRLRVPKPLVISIHC